MNYLAHLFLSGNDEQIMVGNFIGDHVKGKEVGFYPEKIGKGILLHRNIDTFTDTHLKFRETRDKFREGFGLYSGIIADFLYDHFLAKNWNNYSDETLRTFAKRAHAVLLRNFFILPGKVQGFLPFLIQNRRLESYASTQGITDAMNIMGNYTSFPANTVVFLKILKQNYDLLQQNFTDFMADITEYLKTSHGIDVSTGCNSVSNAIL